VAVRSAIVKLWPLDRFIWSKEMIRKKKPPAGDVLGVERRTVIEIGEPLAGEFPYEEPNNA
jgi:hypothetical protein